MQEDQNHPWLHAQARIAVIGLTRYTGHSGLTYCSDGSPAGQHLRSLRVPGTGVNALAWEKGGLRLALAVESFVYFANVQPNYHWSYFSGTIVYAFSKPDRPEACVVFWDLQTHQTQAKYVKRLVSVKVCKLS